MVTPKSQFIQTHPLLAGEGLLIPHQLGGSGLRMNPKPHQLPGDPGMFPHLEGILLRCSKLSCESYD